MKSAPKISVVMTAYNCQDYIQEAVESVLRQDFEDFEFIIVDNNSTDQTGKLIAQYRDPRISFIQNSDNFGQTKALNIGLKRSRASYIARMDGDDAALPQRLSRQYDFLEKNPDVAVVGSWCFDIDPKGKIRRTYKGPWKVTETTCSLMASGDLTSWSVTHPSVMIRKKALEDVGGYREKEGAIAGYPQDYDLWTRLCQKGYRFANIPEPLLKYRILQNSESRYKTDELMKHRFQISKDKVRYYLPQLNEQEVESLVCMLEFHPQYSAREGERVFSLFDQYFEIFCQGSKILPLPLVFRERMKYYYLPQLFLSNKRLAIRKYCQIICSHSRLILDGKFYRKILKTMNVLSQPEQKIFRSLNKTFLFR